MKHCLIFSIDKYLKIINSFLDGVVSIKELQKIFFEEFKKEPAGMNSELYEVLNWLFSDLDIYTEDEYLLNKFPGNYQDINNTINGINMAAQKLEKMKVGLMKR